MKGALIGCFVGLLLCILAFAIASTALVWPFAPVLIMFVFVIALFGYLGKDFF